MMDEKLKKMLENAKEENDLPSSDPVHFDEDKWWFWDEFREDRMGPFNTEEEARKDIKRYCEEVMGKSMDRHDELGSTKCHFCPLEVPEDPEAAKWTMVPRYDKFKKRWKGKKYVWRCARCMGISQRNFKDWLYPGEDNPRNTFGR